MLSSFHGCSTILRARSNWSTPVCWWCRPCIQWRTLINRVRAGRVMSAVDIRDMENGFHNLWWAVTILRRLGFDPPSTSESEKCQSLSFAARTWQIQTSQNPGGLKWRNGEPHNDDCLTTKLWHTRSLEFDLPRSHRRGDQEPRRVSKRSCSQVFGRPVSKNWMPVEKYRSMLLNSVQKYQSMILNLK